MVHRSNSQLLGIEDRINLTLIIKWKIWTWDIQLNQEMEYMWKDMDFYLLLKTWLKVEVINMVKNFLIMLRNLTDALKTASKRAIQKTAEATGDLIGNKIADKITSVKKICKRITK